MNKYKWKSQYYCNPEASKGHEAIRQLFVTEMPFKNFACYQEVPVVDLVPGYSYPTHRFDWYVEELGLVVEVHGRQHYQVVNFGGVGYDDAVHEFREGQFRDGLKQDAAIHAGLSYLAIPDSVAKKLDAGGLLALAMERVK